MKTCCQTVSFYNIKVFVLYTLLIGASMIPLYIICSESKAIRDATEVSANVTDIIPECGNCHDHIKICCSVKFRVNYTIGTRDYRSSYETSQMVFLTSDSQALKWGQKKYPVGSTIDLYAEADDPYHLEKDLWDHWILFVFFTIMLLIIWICIVVLLFCLKIRLRIEKRQYDQPREPILIFTDKHSSYL